MARIDWYEEDNPMLEYDVGGYNYSFSVAKFPVESYDWLCECIQENANKIYARGYNEGKIDVQLKIKSALGL